MSICVQKDYLDGIDTVEGFLAAISGMRDSFMIKHGTEPTDLLIPDSDWHLVDMLVNDNLWKLPKEIQDKIIEKGSGHVDLTFMGMRLLGTIRIAHVK